MNSVIFNMNDVILLLAILQCFLLGAILLFVTNIPFTKRGLLALFLFSMGLDFIDTLIYWAEPIKNQLFSSAVYPFFMLKFSGFLAAPALYLYVKSILFSDFTLQRKTLLHFLPAIFFMFGLPVFILGHDDSFFIAAKSNYDILFHDAAFQVYLLSKHAIYIGYGVCSYRLLANYHQHLQQGYSSTEGIDQLWLRLLVTGFLAIWIIYFGSYLSHIVLEHILFADFFGIMGNYLNLIFSNTLVIYSLVKSQTFQGVEEKVALAHFSDKGNDDQQEYIVTLLNTAMQQGKLYLDPELTLDQLSHKLGVPKKLVSSTINRKFNKNFFEFVNDFRMDEAKLLLNTVNRVDSMLEIMEKSGFNSKSTFNRCFKRATNMTPSEFRDTQKVKAINDAL